ncbi:YidC/Oxa1 family membrane protein insertase [Patescibacteria group bacterium]|nr:YidC/Oxa1 family membrane protein insertase [Patescibacteria group bacterium]
MIGNIYQIVFFQPLYNGLIFLTKILPFNDLGLAIVFLTVIVRFILFPLSHKSIVTQKKIKILEPEINKIKNKHKEKQEEQTKQIMALYKNHGINPFSGFFLILIQLPVFIALYTILRNFSAINSDLLYSFLGVVEKVNTSFLGLIDISKPSYLISILAGLSQFFQIKLSLPPGKKIPQKERSFKDELQRSMGIQMRYVMPVFIFFIAQRFSSGLALYWTTSNIFAIFHEIIVARKAKKLEQNGR